MLAGRRRRMMREEEEEKEEKEGCGGERREKGEKVIRRGYLSPRKWPHPAWGVRRQVHGRRCRLCATLAGSRRRMMRDEEEEEEAKEGGGGGRRERREKREGDKRRVPFTPLVASSRLGSSSTGAWELVASV